MPDILTSISTAINLAKRLKEIGANAKNAEFKNLLADLSLELADVKLRLAEVMTENASLKEQKEGLKAHAHDGGALTTGEGGLYYKPSGDGPFCTGCFDTKRQVVRLSRQKPPFDNLGEYECPACKQFYNSRT